MSEITLKTIEVIDTIVKIGLSAAIAGVCSYFVAVKSHRNEIDKLEIKDRKDLAKEIASKFERVEALFNAVLVHMHSSDIDKSREKLVEASSDIYSIRALANISGSDDLVKYTESCSLTVESVYSEFLKPRPSMQKIDSLGKDITAIKKSAYPHIRNLYRGNRT